MCQNVSPKKVVFTLLPVMLLLSFTAFGHVPVIGGGNDDISSSIQVSNPAKSWAFYGVLEKDKVHYFSFDVREKKKIHLELLKSTDPKDEGFRPELLMLGPGIGQAFSSFVQQQQNIDRSGNGTLAEDTIPENVAENSVLPEQIILPESLMGIGALLANESEEKAATYEPFGPSSYIKLAELDLSAPQSGRYYAVVYENNTWEQATEAKAVDSKRGGHYSLVVGYREEVSFTDRMIAPVQLASVYIWGGQSLIMILIPYVVALIIGILIYWRGSRRTLFCLAGTLAGFLFLGTSSLVLTQMIYNLSRAFYGPEVYITMAIIVFHAFLGVACIRLARGEAGILQRSLLAVIGTITLLGGSGMILGPILAISASFLPSRRRPAPGDLLPADLAGVASTK